MNTNEHFKFKELWENYDQSGNIQKHKIPSVIKNIPSDTENILDVGCGNGIITNVLNEKYELVGVDMSEEALRNLNCKSICCHSDNIPLKTNSFDMVFSSQLLEHLKDDVLVGTIQEFKRIARKYILITVPNKELLEKNYTKCPQCNNVFNVNGHLQTFSLERMAHLIDGFYLDYHEFIGASHKSYNKWLLRCRHNIGNRYFHPTKFTICPYCGNTAFPEKKGNIISKVCNGINRIISSRKPYWLLVLYRVKDN